MLPEWNHIPMYAVLALLGAGAAWFYVHHRLRRRGENPGRTEQAFLWGVLGAMLGAKLLYLLPLLPQLAADLPLLCTAPHSFMAKYLSGGFVFYGGLLGGLAGAWLFCKQRRLSFDTLGRDLVPALPLFHAFGRVGCFLAGCCYGIPAPAGWLGVTFPASAIEAPSGVPLLPVQLSAVSPAGPSDRPGLAGRPPTGAVSGVVRCVSFPAGVSAWGRGERISWAAVYVAGDLSGGSGRGVTR